MFFIAFNVGLSKYVKMNKELKKCFIIFQWSICFVCTELKQSQKCHKKYNPDVDWLF